MGPGWGDRWRPRRQANPFQVSTDGPRVGESCHDLYLSAAPITYGHVKLKHPCQQHSPGQPMPALRRRSLRRAVADVGLLNWLAIAHIRKTCLVDDGLPA